MTILLFLALGSVLRLSAPEGGVYQQVQLAGQSNKVAATFVSGNKVLFTESSDGGQTWPAPRTVAQPGFISAGRHRGPRIAIAGKSTVISLVAGPLGGGKDGDLLAFRSTDDGATWKLAAHINDVPNSAREGLHAMAAGPNGLVYAVWLDHRKTGARLYGSASHDGGATWSPNKEVYASPDGSICQCCHPSVAIDGNGLITVMWRNLIAGDRDFYLSKSSDGGKTFSAAAKLGAGSWKLDACPMDGGGVVYDRSDKPVTVWRREQTIYTARPNEPEKPIHAGKDPAIAVGGAGTFLSWRDSNGLESLGPGQSAPALLDPDGQYGELLALPNGHVLAAWESQGAIRFQTLP